jgi:hypothetical protein
VKVPHSSPFPGYTVLEGNPLGSLNYDLLPKRFKFCDIVILNGGYICFFLKINQTFEQQHIERCFSAGNMCNEKRRATTKLKV